MFIQFDLVLCETTNLVDAKPICFEICITQEPIPTVGVLIQWIIFDNCEYCFVFRRIGLLFSSHKLLLSISKWHVSLFLSQSLVCSKYFMNFAKWKLFFYQWNTSMAGVQTSFKLFYMFFFVLAITWCII